MHSFSSMAGAAPTRSVLPSCPCDDERCARLGARARGHPRVPRGAAVLHAGRPRGRVDPRLEDHGLAEVQEVVLRAARRARACQRLHEPGADQRHRAGADRLREVAAPRPRDRGAGKGAHADHQQVERARQQLDDERARSPAMIQARYGSMASFLGRREREDDSTAAMRRARRLRRGAWRRSPWCSRPPSPARRRGAPCSIFTQRSSTDLEPGGLGLARAACVLHAQLHPEHLRADGDGVLGDRRDLLALAEAVDDVHLVRDVAQRLVALLARGRCRTAGSPGSRGSRAPACTWRRSSSAGTSWPTARPPRWCGSRAGCGAAC